MLAPRDLDPSASDTVDAPQDDAVSRRGFGRRLLLGASALGVLLAAGKRDAVQAAPGTDPWRLGGNTSVNTDGSNFLGARNVAPLIFKTAVTTGRPLERLRITPTGNVGIGVATPAATLHTKSTGAFALIADTSSTGANATGVLGRVLPTTPGTDAAGVWGANSGTTNYGAGVRGSHAGGGVGVHGTSVRGDGVVTKAGRFGVFADGGTIGVVAYGTQYGVFGSASLAQGYGGYFTNSSGTSDSTVGVGVIGFGNGGSDSYIHPSGSFFDAGGEFSGPNGVIGAAARPNGFGVIGLQGAGARAGHFVGDVVVTGNLTKPAGSFMIDHPLDPENKYLYHSFVESPDMMNVYNGNVTTDAQGEATVELPAYFEALNMDFRYQLTPIGQLAQAAVIDEINGNQFTIKTDKPNVKVSWQVTGIRQDAYANAHRIEVEVAKEGEERGRYLAPEAFGQPSTKGVGLQGHRRAKRPTPPAPPVRPEQAP